MENKGNLGQGKKKEGFVACSQQLLKGYFESQCENETKPETLFSFLDPVILYFYQLSEKIQSKILDFNLKILKVNKPQSFKNTI